MKIYIPRENKIAEQPQGFQFVGYDFCFTGACACGSGGYLNNMTWVLTMHYSILLDCNFVFSILYSRHP